MIWSFKIPSYICLGGLIILLLAVYFIRLQFRTDSGIDKPKDKTMFESNEVKNVHKMFTYEEVSVIAIIARYSKEGMMEIANN
jgi:hypothetical protein